MNTQKQGKWGRFAKIVLPHYCVLCASPTTTLLCQPCERDLPKNSNPCAQCALPLAIAKKTEKESHTLCGQCLKNAPQFDCTLTAFQYRHTIPTLINRFKHKNQMGCGRMLSNALTHTVKHYYLESSYSELPNIITYTPLHWQRLLKRGFNQAAVIAKIVGQSLSISPLSIIEKIEHTQQQQTLTRKERLKGLKGAFKVKTNIEGAHIALVDDVITTGATAETLSALLKKAGAHRVDVWGLARTPNKQNI